MLKLHILLLILSITMLISRDKTLTSLHSFDNTLIITFKWIESVADGLLKSIAIQKQTIANISLNYLSLSFVVVLLPFKFKIMFLLIMVVHSYTNHQKHHINFMAVWSDN